MYRIFSLLFYLTILAAGLLGLAYLFLAAGIDSGWTTGDSSGAHTGRGIMYGVIGSGLPLSVLTTAVSGILTLIYFFFRRWIRTAICIGIVLGAVCFWRYCLSIPFPLN